MTNKTPCTSCAANRAMLVSDQLEFERRSIDTTSHEDAALYLDRVIEIGELIAELDDFDDCTGHDGVKMSAASIVLEP